MSLCEEVGFTSWYQCVGKLSRVSRLVLFVDGQVEGRLSVRPSCYQRLQLELWFIVFATSGGQTIRHKINLAQSQEDRRH
jgi:hypothetical protein